MGSATAFNSTIDPNSIFDMIYSVPSINRSGAVFKISSTKEREIRKLKDGNGRHLCFGDSNVVALLGYPIEWDDSHDLLEGEAVKFVQRDWHKEEFVKGGLRCEYCGTLRTSGDKSCRDGCGAPY